MAPQCPYQQVFGHSTKAFHLDFTIVVNGGIWGCFLHKLGPLEEGKAAREGHVSLSEVTSSPEIMTSSSLFPFPIPFVAEIDSL